MPETLRAFLIVLGSDMVVGVVGGLVAALAIYLFREWWKNHLQPWYEERIYRDAKIEGIWEGVFKKLALADEEGRDPRKEIITLYRKGHNVKGTAICTSGPDHGKKYDIEAVFGNLILCGTYRASDQSKLDRGSFSLKLVQNGEKFEGYTSLYYDPDDTIVSSKYEWTKKT